MEVKTNFQKAYFYISLIIVFALLILIFCLSHEDGKESTETSGWFTTLLNFLLPFPVTENIVRTLAHFSEFACLSFFMNNLFVSKKEKLLGGNHHHHGNADRLPGGAGQPAAGAHAR